MTVQTTPRGRELASPDSRRPPRATRLSARRDPLFNGDPGTPRGPAAGGTHRVRDPRPTSMPQLDPEPETWWESIERAQRAREGRLRSLWQMTPAQRVAAMRRGDLTYEQLAAWSARHPEQVPVVHGEFEWILAKLPEVCE